MGVTVGDLSETVAVTVVVEVVVVVVVVVAEEEGGLIGCDASAEFCCCCIMITTINHSENAQKNNLFDSMIFEFLFFPDFAKKKNWLNGFSRFLSGFFSLGFSSKLHFLFSEYSVASLDISLLEQIRVLENIVIF